MDILGVIPARGGSKGIPGKNLAPLAGRPLIDYTIEAAVGAQCLSRIIVSTDDPAIAKHVLKHPGVEVPAMRPAALAQDDTPILPVLTDLLESLQKQGDPPPDAVCLLQPTSPLRVAKDVDAGADLLAESGGDAVVSVVPVPHHCNPVSVMRCDPDCLLSPYLEASGDGVTRRQDKPALVARNGPAVLMTKTATLRAGSLYGEHCVGLLMPRERSVDIDEPIDLVIAEALLAWNAHGTRVI
ncbi:acylneuraminate cytidylyltransferase family protein [Phycisphaeraceae bacterium D3-23]